MADPSTVIVNGNVGLFNARQQAAAAGVYYMATNATPGTALSSGLITTYSATADGHCTIVNNNVAGSGINIYLDYVKFHMTGTAPATTTSMEFNIATDVAAGISPSAGNTTLTARNVNTASTTSSLAVVDVASGGAAMTIPAATASRKNVGRASIPTSLGITGDIYVLQFGGVFGDLAQQGGGAAVRSTAAARLSANTVPVVLAPGYGCVVNMWWLTQTTNKPFFEWEITWMEI